MGGCRCTFRKCENSTSGRPGLHFFHYPIRDSDRLKKWVEVAEKKEFMSLPIEKLKNKVVCEEHFEERCFMNVKHERLIKSAVPSIYKSLDGELLDVSDEAISRYEVLTIEPVSNGANEINEPVLLNRKRPLLLNTDFKRPDDFVVDLNLEGLQNGDLTISFEEAPIVSTTGQSLSVGATPAKQPKIQRTSYYQASETPRKESNRILNSSLNLNAKLAQAAAAAEPIVLNNSSGHADRFEGRKRSSPAASGTMSHKEKQQAHSGNATTPVTGKQASQIVSSNKQAVSSLGFDIIDVNSSPEHNLTYQTFDLTAVTDTVYTAIKSMNAVDKNLFETRCAEHAISSDEIKKLLTTIKSKQDEFTKDFKMTQDSLKKIATNQTAQMNLLNAQASEASKGGNSAATKAPSAKAESTTASGVKSKFNQNKTQLFNGIKKYLNPAMVALLRMELFGGTEREWKSDEKSISVELLNLGHSTYDYIRDEWRFRLPAKKEVEKWTNDNLDDDEEESDAN